MNNCLYKLKFNQSGDRCFNIYKNEPKYFETYQEFTDSFNSILIANDGPGNILLKLGEKNISIKKNNKIKKYLFYKFLYQNEIIWVNKNSVEKL